MDFDGDRKDAARDVDPTRSAQAGVSGSEEPSVTGAFGAERIGAPGSASDDAGTRAGSYDRKFTGEEQSAVEGASEKLGEGRERLIEAVDAGRNRVAGQLERISDRLAERGRGMEEAGGVQRRASQVALRAGEALDSGAEYLRSHDPDEMRDDLERSIRERPLLSVGIAAGAGFLLARLLRD